MKAARGEENPHVQREEHQNNVRPVYTDLAGRKSWQDIFRALSEKNMQPRILIQQGCHSELMAK